MCAPTHMPTASTRGRPQKAEQVPSIVAHHAETPANPLIAAMLQSIAIGPSCYEAIRFCETTAHR